MGSDKPSNILSLLNVTPSPQSFDFVKCKKQYQLHSLLTEQRHPLTWNLSGVIKDNTEEGLRQIFAVDEDISRCFRGLVKDLHLLERASLSISTAIRRGKKIFIYGCGATGRSAKQVESSFWRPFWRRLKSEKLWGKIRQHVSEEIESRLIGEMTGGDRALISSLEGFEDLHLVGKLQLEDRGIKKGDVVFGITEGGETSSVIGTVQAAVEQYEGLDSKKNKEAQNHIFFLFNNPEDVLQPLDRSRSIIENPAVTKINLATGPQAITGSTRMQAATSETFIMGIILEAGIFAVLREILSDDELLHLGFSKGFCLRDRLLSFASLAELVFEHVKDIAGFTNLESQTYKNLKKSTYFAKKALVTVFTDCTERSPTFRLFPLDTVREKQRKCWLQVWTEGRDYRQAWQSFLGRDFLGLSEQVYKPYFLDNIDDDYLKEAALRSLRLAGNDQEKLYDFSFSDNNISTRGPQVWDMGVVVCMGEEIEELAQSDSVFSRFIHLFKEKEAGIALVLIGSKNEQRVKKIIGDLPLDGGQDVIISLPLPDPYDPLDVSQHILLKILLNGHSTGVMARLGRVVGNTMTNVNPSNLKLIGRATNLILSHVNDVLSQEEWIQQYGKIESLEYWEVNAILFDAMNFVAEKGGGQTSEVELSILRILEALKNKRDINWEKTLYLLEDVGLETYLERHNPALRRFF